MTRIETKTRTIHTFDELDDDAKQAAIESNRESQVTDEWYEHTIENWQSLLSAIGIKEAEIRFSGFCSQGDGATIANAIVDPDELLGFLSNCPPPADTWADESDIAKQSYLAHKLGWVAGKDSRLDWLRYFSVLDEYSFSFRCTNYHYSHENSHYIEVDGYSKSDDISSAVDAFADKLNDMRRQLCRIIYSDLRAEYEYLTSDEFLTGWLSDTGMEFYESGSNA